MPNGAYLHLLINHVPVILAPLGAAVVILAWIMHRRAVWLYGLATLTLAGLSAYPVMATGDSAAHTLRHAVPTVSRATIHAHEEAGDTTMWVLLAGGVVAAYAWWRLGRSPLPSGASQAVGTLDAALPLWLRALVVLLALGSTGMVTYTSEKGGYIVHHEAHPGSIPDTLAGPPPAAGQPGR